MTPCGSRKFIEEILRVIRDDPDWECNDRSKQIAVTKENMGKLEPLMKECNLTEWQSKF